ILGLDQSTFTSWKSAPVPLTLSRTSQLPPPPQASGTGSTSCLSSWRLWIRPVFCVIYGLCVFTAIPLIIVDVIHEAQGDQRLLVILSGVAFFAVIICIFISVLGITNHIVCYTRPPLQKRIIRILLIVPIYGLNSWFALRFPASNIYLDTLREFYQAYVIYNFVLYLLAFFEEVPNFDNRLTMKPQIKAPCPACCVVVYPSQSVIRRCKRGIVIYMIIRIVCTVVSLITYFTNTFNEGNYTPKDASLWVTVILTTAQLWATYCLILLRKSTFDELQMLPKSTWQFIGVKLTVFVDNFQSVFLHFLANVGAIKPTSDWGFIHDGTAFATMLQDFLICIELVFVAVLFYYCFDYQRYNVDGHTRLSIAQSFKQILGLSRATSIQTGQLGPESRYSNQEGIEQSPGNSTEGEEEAPSRKEDAEVPRRRKTGHQYISMPDIILNHMEESNQLDRIHHPSNQLGGDQCRDDDDSNQDGGIGNPGFETEVNPKELEATPPNDDQSRDDISCDTDDSLDDEFPTDDDNDSDNDLPIDGRLDAPPQRRRVKKVSYAGMTFDDLDVNKLKDPSQNTPVATSKKRAKKVSYAGMTFEDMDWEQIKSHRSPTMDSEMAHTVTSIMEENEKRRAEGKQGEEGFGSSDA
ncbi:transmembrane protein 184B-like, partial [Acanthaster planci]|uniref:Transmembrane protein 184B-like n=1 Tax=Acanthaster planci TaxID=133434 RepID=A0A8B7Y253_ACAPL